MRIHAATLYHGDCKEILTQIQDVGAIVTDPPYGMNYRSGANSSNSISSTGKRFTETVDGDDKPFDPSPWVSFDECVMTGAQHYYDRLPAGGSLHCWNKRGDYKPLDQADADLIWRKSPGVSRVFGLVWRGLCRHAENRDEIRHPTQKPIALMEWMVGMTDGIVLDPFMGSGTTGVACANLGRGFIGIEKKRKYFDIAVERITAAYAQQRLFA